MEVSTIKSGNSENDDSFLATFDQDELPRGDLNIDLSPIKSNIDKVLRGSSAIMDEVLQTDLSEDVSMVTMLNETKPSEMDVFLCEGNSVHMENLGKASSERQLSHNQSIEREINADFD